MSKNIELPKLKRFLSDNPVEYEQAIAAAETYVSSMEESDVNWLYSKPYDASLGNSQYFRLMYDLLNILEAMNLAPGSRILEVGSGPGWITEILLMLGFSVDALEPSQDMIKIAQERCRSLAFHYRKESASSVQFQHGTLEEVYYEDESFDCVLFFDVLHHVVDEEVGLAKTLRFLKPGGCIGVVEGSWHPDFRQLEETLIQEMKRFGTLENPFSVDYLDYLLQKAGFTDIVRYVGINGFYSEDQLFHPLKDYSLCPLFASNNIIARKPLGDYPNCYDLSYKTTALCSILDGGINSDSKKADLKVLIKNTGETVWKPYTIKKGDVNVAQRGCVTVALRQGEPGNPSFKESLHRHVLPKIVLPGESINLSLSFPLPVDSSLEGWEIDLICEGIFWFSSIDKKSSTPVL